MRVFLMLALFACFLYPFVPEINNNMPGEFSYYKRKKQTIDNAVSQYIILQIFCGKKRSLNHIDYIKKILAIVLIQFTFQMDSILLPECPNNHIYIHVKNYQLLLS